MRVMNWAKHAASVWSECVTFSKTSKSVFPVIFRQEVKYTFTFEGAQWGVFTAGTAGCVFPVWLAGFHFSNNGLWMVSWRLFITGAASRLSLCRVKVRGRSSDRGNAKQPSSLSIQKLYFRCLLTVCCVSVAVLDKHAWKKRKKPFHSVNRFAPAKTVDAWVQGNTGDSNQGRSS